MYMEAPGTSVSIGELTLPKAHALASFLDSGKHPYATLIDTRRDTASGVETIVFDVVVELNQTRVNQCSSGNASQLRL